MNNEQLTEKVFEHDHRLTALEERVNTFATTAEVNKTVSRIELAHHETAMALKNLAEKFEGFSTSYNSYLRERAEADKSEREEKLQMVREEHEAKLKAIQEQNDAKIKALTDKTWPETIVRWGKVVGLVTGLITILTTLVALLIWLVKTVK